MYSQNDQFDSVTKSNIEERTKRITQLARHGLGSVAKQTCKGNHGNTVHAKDKTRVNTLDVCDNNSDGHKDQQKINPAIGQDHPKGPAGLLNDTALLLATCDSSSGSRVIATVGVVVVGDNFAFLSVGNRLFLLSRADAVYERPLLLILRAQLGRAGADGARVLADLGIILGVCSGGGGVVGVVCDRDVVGVSFVYSSRVEALLLVRSFGQAAQEALRFGRYAAIYIRRDGRGVVHRTGVGLAMQDWGDK